MPLVTQVCNRELQLEPGLWASHDSTQHHTAQFPSTQDPELEAPQEARHPIRWLEDGY